MKRLLLALALLCSFPLVANTNPNQTTDLSPVTDGSTLPFTVTIEKANFELPVGFQGGASATHDGKVLLIAGRTNGLHGFDPVTTNFPANQQNTSVFVIDLKKGKTYSRSLSDKKSGLTQQQIDFLSVTAPQHYQKDGVLYITGGYGVDTATGLFSTKPMLTAVDIKGMMSWVMQDTREKAKHFIRQLSHPIFKITGGEMFQIDDHPTLLVFGQSFDGFYGLPQTVQQVYSNQVRRFRILDNGKKLKVKVLSSKPKVADPNYRRRDLNVVPVIAKKKGKLKQSLVALSGVFTEQDGIWTVPVEIKAWGNPSMKNPAAPTTFKQAMNNYASARCGFYSEKKNEMYTLLLGGITYGFFDNGTFQTDVEFPFTNQITAVKIDKKGNYSQYLVGEYPTIISTSSNPGNTLLFGSEAIFVAVSGVDAYKNDVLKFDAFSRKSQCIGYIIGGIQSTLPITNTSSDSAASPYIFKVMIQRR